MTEERKEFLEPENKEEVVTPGETINNADDTVIEGSVERPAFCEECGSPLQAGDAFCPECGAKIVTEEAASTVPAKKNKKKIKIAVIAIIVVLIITLAGSGGIKLVAGSMAEEKGVGFWESESMYLEAYHGTCQRMMEIKSDGTFYGLIYNTGNGDYEEVFYGTWTMEDGRLALKEDDSYGTAYYSYHLNDTLKNGDITYERMPD